MTDRRLMIIRHAKAAAGGPDAERPLEPRGERDAAAAGRWLAARHLCPDRVVVSPARRTRQTWALIAGELTGAPDPDADERVYDNTVPDLLAVVGDTPADVRTLAIVGHSPSVQELALALASASEGAGTPTSRELAERYPTSAIAVFVVHSPWAQVDGGALESFAMPRG